MEKFRIGWSKPAQFQTKESLYEHIRQLDEAEEHLQMSIFDDFKGSIFQFSSDYMALHARSFMKPILEVWGWSLNLQWLIGILSPASNPELFSTKIEKKIFRKFPIPVTWNRLQSKHFYSADIKVQKFSLAIQGFQTKQFFNDFTPALSRLIRFVDISKNVDPKRTFLPYLQGIDQIRNQKHGRLKIDINKSYVEVWPIRRINRFDQPLTIELFDLEYEQATIKKRDSHPVTL